MVHIKSDLMAGYAGAEFLFFEFFCVPLINLKIDEERLCGGQK